LGFISLSQQQKIAGSSDAQGAVMENYYTNQSKNLEVRAQGNTQVVEYIPVEEIASKAQVEEFGFGELWRRLMQRKWLLLGVAFSTFLAAIILTMTSPNVYRATTTLQVTPEDGPALNLGDGDGAGRAPTRVLFDSNRVAA
jgi:uncharacterized protein involved in exopolysaccharide biosynthesis